MELMKLVDKLEKNNVHYSLFHEPDYNNEATSVCIEPGELTRKFTSNYRLAFKQQQDPVAPTGQSSAAPNRTGCGFEPHLGHNYKSIKITNHEKHAVDQFKPKSIVSFIYRTIKNKFKLNKN